MSAHHPIPRSHPGRATQRLARPLHLLPEARSEVAAFSEANPKWKPMLELYDRICSACGSVLFGSVIMGGGLVLAARSDVAQNEGVILIYFNPAKSRFSLQYRHDEIQPEQSEFCSSTDVWERVRLFLGYKFGVRIVPVKNG